MESSKQVRDYDKEPIVIEDYNPLFPFLLMISLIPIMIYVYIYNPWGASEDSLARNMLIIIPLIMYPYIKAYFKSKGKRRIFLEENSIRFMHENMVIEKIQLQDITDIKKTYSSIYHKSQKIKWFQSFGLYVIAPLIIIVGEAYYLIFVIPIVALFVTVAKYIFHKLKDRKYKYKLFDAIIIYGNSGFINILPASSKEYTEVRNYFLSKELGDIQNKKIYFELIGDYGFENITLNEGK